ncbi:MAG: sugar fermentation stimulation protein [Oligoflexia bacterium]|nr:MAG: sugar fermentation stimulation protein [Oligoflexia bacterium]
MKWEQAPLRGQFLKRYKRFFADIQLGEQVVVAHVPNTGSLKSCQEPGRPALLSPAKDPERKLKFTLEAIQVSTGTWVGVNTSWPNKLVQEAFQNRVIPEWTLFDQYQPEVKISPETRLDACLTNSKTGQKRYIEVKNVTLKEKDFACFPDAVTERGQKHLLELMKLVEQGHQAELVFTIQREDCFKFRPADEIDPEYGRLLRLAHKKGVIISPFVIQIDEKGILLSGKKLECDFGGEQ